MNTSNTLMIALAISLLPLASNAGKKTPSSHHSQAIISRISVTLKQDLARKNLHYAAPIFLRIFKAEKQLEVWVKDQQQFKLFKTYPVCNYGNGSLGPKIKEGDKQAPEGFYFVTPKQLNPYSKYHLSFNLGYPNEYDRFHNRTGSALMVHGHCVSIGCFAMTNDKIEEIYALAEAALSHGQTLFRVHIFPFRMTQANMNKYIISSKNESQHDTFWSTIKAYFFGRDAAVVIEPEHQERYTFWRNLKTGYDLFAVYGNNPPNVEVNNGLYVFDQTK